MPLNAKMFPMKCHSEDYTTLGFAKYLCVYKQNNGIKNLTNPLKFYMIIDILISKNIGHA